MITTIQCNRRMGFKCYLCKCAPDKVKKISLHRFPDRRKYPHIYNQWIAACALNEKDDVSGIRICSCHFREQDKLMDYALTLINPGAIPSINVKNQKAVVQQQIGKNNDEIPTRPHNEKTSDLVSTVEKLSQIAEKIIVENVRNMDDLDNHFEVLYGCIAEKKTCITITFPMNSGSTPLENFVPVVTHNVSRISIVDVSRTPKRTLDATLAEKSWEFDTPQKKRRYFYPRHISELQTSDMATPRRASSVIKFVKEEDKTKTLKIKNLQATKKHLQKRLSALKGLLCELRKQGMISEDAGNKVLSEMPDTIRRIFSRRPKCRRQYSSASRSFALSLHFYSPKAYKYVRDKWENLLPAVSTLRQWYRVVDGKPGFTKEAFDAITLRGCLTDKPVIVNLVGKEIVIREQVIYDKNTFHRKVSIGTHENNQDPVSNNIVKVTNALFLMAVSLNENWRIPIGYFLIKSLNEEERSNLLVSVLQQLHDCGLNVFSLTFDGAATSISMCTPFGANFNYSDPNFKPYFTNPVTKEPCYVFYDLYHMIKLVRNSVYKKIMRTTQGGIIDFEYLKKMQKLQNQWSLRTANKLSKKHINFQNNRMNVHLAVQTLSRSVHNSLLFLQNLPDGEIQSQFRDCNETAKFCLMFNIITDILNCKNTFWKDEFNWPLTDQSFETLQKHAMYLEHYITTLLTDDGKPILESHLKTGFVGLIICLRNMFALFNVLKKQGMTCLLTFKLSQHYLETFFSGVRARGGFNNIPNVLQMKKAYKQLLVRH